MPYVSKHQRGFAPACPTPSADQPGILNYQITCLLRNVVEENRLSYAVINDALGAVEGAKLEFYRRVAAPYEDNKIEENGDVYQ